MSPELVSDLMLYWLTAITTMLSVGLFLKTHFWASLIRLTILTLVLGLCATSWYIIARRLNWITADVGIYASALIFGSIAGTLTVLFILLMRYNWSYWSWTAARKEGAHHDE